VSTTVGQLRFKVRESIRETDGRRASFDPIEIDQAIARAYLVLSAQLPPPVLYTANAFTIAANAQTFTLPSTIPSGYISTAGYAGDVRIQLASNGVFLAKRTREEIEALRNGNTIVTGTTWPQVYALYEDGAQVVQGESWPRAQAAESCHLYRTLVVDDLRDHTTDLEAATIMFGRWAQAALELYAAADLLARMTEEDLALRRIDKGAASLWVQQAERLLYQEAKRLHDLKAVGRTLRWVA